MYCNNNHRIILCMIIINYFRAKHFREAVVRGTCNSSKVIFEQLTFEQLISSNSSSSNLPRFVVNSLQGVCEVGGEILPATPDLFLFLKHPKYALLEQVHGAGDKWS
jgi:hypothetical protein